MAGITTVISHKLRELAPPITRMTLRECPGKDRDDSERGPALCAGRRPPNAHRGDVTVIWCVALPTGATHEGGEGIGEWHLRVCRSYARTPSADPSSPP